MLAKDEAYKELMDFIDDDDEEEKSGDEIYFN